MNARATVTFFSLVLAIAAVALPIPPRPLPPPPPPGEPPGQWFLAQRRDAAGGIPAGARGLALAAARQRGLTDAAGSWSAVGPLNVGGRITSFAVDPGDVDHFWVGAADGGVFETSDGGQTFAPVFDAQTNLSIGSLAAHPTDSAVVYVGTGEDGAGGYAYPGEGVFKTVDGGASWSSMGLAEVRRITKIAVDPLTPQTVFVAAGGGFYNLDGNRGIYRSTDGGLNWSRVLWVADDTGAADVAIDPADPSRVFAAMWERSRANGLSYFGGADSGIWRSVDGGDSWSRLSGGLPADADIGRIGLGVAPSNPQVVYAVIYRAGGSLRGIYRSLDGGDSWALVSAGTLPFFFSSFGYYFGQVRVDPVDAQTVYVLDLNIWRSTNGGTIFNQISSGVHVDQHALQILGGGVLIAGNDGGFYRSDNDGAGWTHADNLAITQYYDLCVDPADGLRRFGGTQDNGTIRTVTGGSSDWQNVLGGDGMQCDIDPVDPMKVYAESQWGGIARSTDGGASFSGATSGIDPADRNNWVQPITHDPLATGVLYTGTQRVYRSVDAAVSWQPISDNLTNQIDGHGAQSVGHGEDHGQDPIQGTVTAIAVSPVDTDVIWAGTDDGNVWVTDNGGALWSQVNPPSGNFWVTEIAADPLERETAYLTIAGYRSDDTMPYVQKTADLGQSWVETSVGLPQVPTNDVVRDPDWRGRLFVANDVGVAVSDDDGASWSMLDDGMPFVVVLDLVLHQATRTLYAGSHGRSIFSFDLAQLGPADGDGDGVDNNADCALADPGAFAAPGEVTGLTVGKSAGGTAEIAWDSLAVSAGPGTTYDVARGNLADLVLSGTSASSSLSCDLTLPMAADATPAAPGEGFWYLSRGRNSCGLGGWGGDSAGSPRSSPACP